MKIADRIQSIKEERKDGGAMAKRLFWKTTNQFAMEFPTQNNCRIKVIKFYAEKKKKKSK